MLIQTDEILPMFVSHEPFLFQRHEPKRCIVPRLSWHDKSGVNSNYQSPQAPLVIFLVLPW